MATEARVKELIAGNKVMVFSKSYCPFCKKAKEALNQYTSDYGVLEVSSLPDAIIQHIAALSVFDRQFMTFYILHACVMYGACATVLYSSFRRAGSPVHCPSMVVLAPCPA